MIRFARLVRRLAPVVVALALAPSEARAEGPKALGRIVKALAPGATPVDGGFRFDVGEVAVSVLPDEGAGLLRVVARAGGLSDRDVGLVAGALGPDLVPDPAARLVSVRGLVCSAVLAPLRGVTDAVLRRAVEGAVRVAREAAHTPDRTPEIDPALAGLATPAWPPVR